MASDDLVLEGLGFGRAAKQAAGGLGQAPWARSAKACLYTGIMNLTHRRGRHRRLVPGIPRRATVTVELFGKLHWTDHCAGPAALLPDAIRKSIGMNDSAETQTWGGFRIESSPDELIVSETPLGFDVRYGQK